MPTGQSHQRSIDTKKLPATVSPNSLLKIFLVFIIVFTATTDSTADAAPNTINLEITTHLGDNQTFTEGDSLAFFISLDQDAHLLVLYQDASGQLVQIIPNDHMNDKQYEAGLFIRVPDISTQHHFKITAPFGNEKIYAFASNKPLPLQQGDKISNGLKLLTGRSQQVISKLRQHKQSSKTAWGEAILNFKTRTSSWR